MRFSQALETVFTGKAVFRESDKHIKCIYMIEASEFCNALKYGYGEYAGEPTIIRSLAAQTSDNNLIIGWTPSNEDMNAIDWQVCPYTSADTNPTSAGNDAIESAKTLVRKLDGVKNQYRGRRVDTFEVSIPAMVDDCTRIIENLIKHINVTE